MLKDSFLCLSLPLDVNECESSSTKCDLNANCFNTPGSFRCRCRLGYQGNGTHCVCEFAIELSFFTMTIFDYIDYRNSFRLFIVNPPKVKKRSNNPNLHIRKQKTTNWRILVVDGKWRHRAVFLNVFVGSFVTFYPWCNAHIIVLYFPFAADGTCDGVICDQNSACVPITLGGRDRQCVCLDGWSGDGRSCTGTK